MHRAIGVRQLPFRFLQHSERIADPAVVAALFSLVLSMRNRLQAMGNVSRGLPHDTALPSLLMPLVVGSKGPFHRSRRLCEGLDCLWHR